MRNHFSIGKNLRFSEGFEKNIDKVVEYTQKDEEYLNKGPDCADAQPFIQQVVADLKKAADKAKDSEDKKSKSFEAEK